MTKHEAKKMVQGQALGTQLAASVEYEQTGTLAVVKQQLALSGEDLADFVLTGDLSQLPPEAKIKHYNFVCNSLGLNPATKPFDYIVLNKKEVLYANKGCAEQLRKLHKVSFVITSREMVGDIYVVTARSSLPDGRQDESIGAVSTKGLSGDNLANAMMKAETKSKRRATLSILGLNMLDESELETIPSHKFDNLPQEQPKPVKASLPAQNRTVKEKAERPAANLPVVPEKIVEVPAWFVIHVKPISQYGGMMLRDLHLEDLELIYSELKRASPRMAKDRSWNAWCLALIQDVQIAMDAFSVPPPTDQDGPVFDAATGEVIG